MELRDLRYFLAVVEAGSLTRAATAVHTAQPTLSHAIARLEAAAREPLLERSPNRRDGVRPTQAGRLLMERARRAIGELEGFTEDLAGLRGVLTGEVRIASIQSLNGTLLPVPLAAFATHHPNVRVSLRTLPAEEVPAALRQGRADLALIAGAPRELVQDLDCRTLGKEEFVAIVRRDDPLAGRKRVKLAALADRPWITALPGTFLSRMLLDACRQAGFQPNVVLELESGEALRETVRAGLGLTVLPAGYLPAKDPDLVGIRLSDPTPEREILALLPTGRPAAHAALAFLQQLKPRIRP